jgi:hypothetical protein
MSAHILLDLIILTIFGEVHKIMNKQQRAGHQGIVLQPGGWAGVNNSS